MLAEAGKRHSSTDEESPVTAISPVLSSPAVPLAHPWYQGSGNAVHHHGCSYCASWHGRREPGRGAGLAGTTWLTPRWMCSDRRSLQQGQPSSRVIPAVTGGTRSHGSLAEQLWFGRSAMAGTRQERTQEHSPHPQPRVRTAPEQEPGPVGQSQPPRRARGSAAKRFPRARPWQRCSSARTLASGRKQNCCSYPLAASPGSAASSPHASAARAGPGLLCGSSGAIPAPALPRDIPGQRQVQVTRDRHRRGQILSCLVLW